MAFALARELLPYVAVIGADFAYDWVFEDADGEPEPLDQVTAAVVELTGPSGSVTWSLGDGLEILTPNILRLSLDKADITAWSAGSYSGGLILTWADGTDEPVLQFRAERQVLARSLNGVMGGAQTRGGVTTIQRAPNKTRLIRSAGGRLTSIVPQITLSADTWPDDTPVGTVVARVTLDPPGAVVTYQLVDDADGLLQLVDNRDLVLLRMPDAAEQPNYQITIRASVAGGDTGLVSDIDLTLTVGPRGRLRFNDPENSLWLGVL